MCQLEGGDGRDHRTECPLMYISLWSDESIAGAPLSPYPPKDLSGDGSKCTKGFIRDVPQQPTAPNRKRLLPLISSNQIVTFPRSPQKFCSILTSLFPWHTVGVGPKGSVTLACHVMIYQYANLFIEAMQPQAFHFRGKVQRDEFQPISHPHTYRNCNHPPMMLQEDLFSFCLYCSQVVLSHSLSEEGHGDQLLTARVFIMTYKYKFHVYTKQWNSMLGNRWAGLGLDQYISVLIQSSYKIKST